MRAARRLATAGGTHKTMMTLPVAPHDIEDVGRRNVSLPFHKVFGIVSEQVKWRLRPHPRPLPFIAAALIARNLIDLLYDDILIPNCYLLEMY